MEIRQLKSADAAAYHALRLHALQESPEAFAADFSNEQRIPLAQVAERLLGSGRFADHFVFGAFDDSGQLVGMAGLLREQQVKTRHKTLVWGMFVSEACRGQGLGKLLLRALVAQARKMPSVTQVYLAVVPSKEAARRLYLSAGFQPYGIEPRALKVEERYYDLEYMALRLD